MRTVLPAAKYWMSPVGEKDDFGDPITDTFTDGGTMMGPWAIMSPASALKFGVGIGQGLGQLYKRQADGRWLKVGG